MLGQRVNQMSMSDSVWWEHLIPEDSIYARMAQWGNALVSDEEFKDLYAETGRPSESPALLTKVLILMNMDGCSDREAADATRYDLRWKFALGLSSQDAGVDHTTICRFRMRLRENNMERLIFDRLLKLAVEAELMQPNDIQAIDSTLIHGAGATQDTYTLIKASIAKVLKLAKRRPRLRRAMLKSLIRADYETSKKPDIAWDNPTAQNILLNELVNDAKAVLYHVTQIEDRVDPDLAEAAMLLGKILDQDIEFTDEGRVRIKQGVAKDRIVSVTDPDMRHGHKSQQRKVDGYKVHITEDINSELITAVDATAANAADPEPMDEMLDRQQALGLKPTKLIGDTAYGTAENREKLQEQGIEVIAKVPPQTNAHGLFDKTSFHINLEQGWVRCPNGRVTTDFTNAKDEAGRSIQVYRFKAKQCNRCWLKDQCTKSDKGRTIRIHSHEALLQEARQQQTTQEFRVQYRKRAIVERKIAHLMRRCHRRARYLGLEKTRFQMLWAATAENFRRICQLVAGKNSDKLAKWEQALGIL